MNALSINKISFLAKKHSPEILLVAGIAGVIGSAITACRATLKVNDVIEETKESIDKIHTAIEKGETEAGVEYTQKDSKKDLTIVYVQTGIKFIKLYGPSVIIGALSITSILASHNVLHKRNVALGAAYAALDKGFKDYRNRVVERFGENVDRELRYNAKINKRKETIVDPETGEKKKIDKAEFVVNPSDISGYARFFEQYTTDEAGNTIVNRNWVNNNEYNLLFIKGQERFANDLLKLKRRVFLNEVYEMLGLPRTKAGQIVGWVYDPEGGVGDNYIDFGLYKDNLGYSDYVNGHDPAILLDFNVDGNVWELMK